MLMMMMSVILLKDLVAQAQLLVESQAELAVVALKVGDLGQNSLELTLLLLLTRVNILQTILR